MLVLYVVALGIGGTLLAASLLMGGDGADGDVDVDADGDVDHDVDHGGAADAHGAADALMSWLPFASIRFWTFFLAFFGLTGFTLDLLEVSPSQTVTGLVAGGVGYLSGMTIVRTLRKLREGESNTNLDVGDYIGATGLVMLPVARGKLGKIRLELKGRIVELMAITEEDDNFEIEQQVMVYGITEDGRAIVTRPEDAA